jgi:hypothetical protein
MWDTVNFTLDTTLPNYSYTSSTTSIPSTQVPGFTALIQVTIGNSVTSIGEFAFNSCSQLQSITIPNSVTSIDDYAFRLCSQLQSVTIGNSVTSIGPNAFQFSGLTSVTIPTVTANALGISGTPIQFFGANNVNMTYLP